MNGVLVVDKPVGPTSHDVVAVARRAIELSRVGHTGTLDPLATGVLPLVIGRATRLASLMSSADKEYVATIRFGSSTETYDAEKRWGTTASSPTPEAAAVLERLDAAAIEEGLSMFRGRFLQTPPPYSAKKIGGTPAYRLARDRKPVEVRPVEVTVSELVLCKYAGGLADVRLVCSAGFYVRSLAHDLGQRLGCGAHLEGLRRTRAGDFALDDAVTLDRLSAEGVAAAASHLIPMERLLTQVPGVVVTDAGAKRVGHGSALRPEDLRERQVYLPSEPTGGPRLRLLDGSGSLLGLAEVRGDGLLHPVIVLV
jgi:tRNA pseudouridine55 synthase